MTDHKINGNVQSKPIRLPEFPKSPIYSSVILIIQFAAFCASFYSVKEGLRVETYSRSGTLRSYGNLQSYWNTAKLWKLTVVLDYCEAIETYSRIGLLRSYRN